MSLGAAMGRTKVDLLITGGRIVDGTGSPAYAGSVAIRGDRIVAVGDCAGYDAVISSDASGCNVCPGFIDTHAHDDQLLFDDPDMKPKTSQGVTTVIVGNCGVSLAPLVRTDVPPPLTEMAGAFRFKTFGDYVSALHDAPAATNAACLVGHTTLRVATMRDLTRRAMPEELLAMKDLCREALASGAIGLSSGVFYPPARAADWTEVAELAELSGEVGGVYAAHIRDEADGIIEAIDEACKIGARGGTPVILSHHKVMGCANFGRSRETLQHVSETAALQPVGFDVYPYTAGASMLSESIRKIASRTLVTWSQPQPSAAGKDLAEIAREIGVTESEALTSLLPGGAIYFIMDEADVRRILSHPDAMIGSDGVPSKHPHPRLWGTFPRVLGHYARDVGLFSFEEGVRRMTSLPAKRFGLRDRGVLKAGAIADVCVVDPARVADVATFAEPELPSCGIEAVYVSGRLVWNGMGATGARPGRMLGRGGEPIASR
jgi:N-acyl-D-amino-acid deacylase